MSEDPSTWGQVREYVRAIVAADVANGTLTADMINDEERLDVYAHEWADGDRLVIYYHLARTLWCNSSVVRDRQDEAEDLVSRSSVDGIMAACVYLALRDEIVAAVHELGGLSAA